MENLIKTKILPIDPFPVKEMALNTHTTFFARSINVPSNQILILTILCGSLRGQIDRCQRNTDNTMLTCSLELKGMKTCLNGPVIDPKFFQDMSLWKLKL